MSRGKSKSDPTEAEHLRRAAMLETALEAAGLAAWELDLGSNLVLLDERAAGVIGVGESLHGRLDLMAMVHPDDRACVRRSLETHLAGECVAFHASFRFVPRAGEVRWLVARGRLVEAGASRRVVGTVHDATEEHGRQILVRRLLETASVTGPAFFDALVRSLAEVTGARHAAVAELVEPDRVRTVSHWVNGALAPNFEYDLAGTPCENVLEANACQFVDGVAERFPNDAALRKLGIASYLGVPLRSASGVAIGLLHAMSEDPMPDPALLDRVRLFASRAAAELERLQAERALRSAEVRFRSVIEGLNEGVLLTDRDGVALYVNRQFGSTTGFMFEDLAGRPAYEVLFGPDEWPTARQRLRRRLDGEEDAFVVDLVRRDGVHRWVAIKESPFRDEAGQVVGILAALEDITEQVRAETKVREAHEELERRVRDRTAELQTMNRELESFSYSVSHDLRAPLRSINGFGKILQEEFAENLGEEGRDYLRRIVDATRRMGQLIDDLLDLSRTSLHELQRRDIRLSAIAERVAERLSSSDQGRRVVWRIEPDLVANADPTLITVLFDNLLENAWKFTQYLDDATIEFGREEGASGRVYYVRDNGAGFDMAFRDRLFQPFQRLHDSRLFEGTGVGLATVQRVVNRHGGKVWAESAPDEGATFYFTLGRPS
ncbi:MAG: PAS domain S-box protein [Fimbriimonadaceae bacterium]|nr:PAS domain S-box protein [Fimbriimonadaceae bacterium]